MPKTIHMHLHCGRFTLTLHVFVSFRIWCLMVSVACKSVILSQSETAVVLLGNTNIIDLNFIVISAIFINFKKTKWLKKKKMQMFVYCTYNTGEWMSIEFGFFSEVSN